MLLLLLLLQGLISCYAQGPPIIHVNFHLLQNQTELVLRSGSTVIIMCHGNESIAWSSTAIIPLYLSEHQSAAVVSRSQPKHTGTYSCRYTNRSLPHLTTWIHLYISDGDVSSVLVTPLAAISVKEDSDALLRCLVTDPTVKNVTLHYGSVTHEESLPPGMNVTIDPRRGALIRHVQMRFKGHYFCSGWKDGNRFTSKALELRVKSRLCLLPTLSVSQDTFVHLEGERFEVTCRTDHPLHSYTVAWKYPNSEALVTTRSQQYSGHLYINDTLTVTSVTTLHSGKYICAAENECGVATSTVHLKVIAHPYLRMYLQQRNTRTTAANEVKKDTDPYEMKVQPEVNSSSDGEEWILNVNTSSLYTNASMNGSSRVEVFEDSDLTITFVMEAYPLITTHRWTTPNHVTNNKSDVYQQTYTDGYRSEASLVLRRVRSEERGRYSFHFSNAFFSGVHHIDLRIYRSPNTEITLENDTLTCSIFGYPSPTVFWFTCTGVEETCKDVPEHEVYWTDVTSNDQDVVMTQLSLPTADDVIVKCVGNNSMGESRGVFVPRKTATLFTPVLLTAVSLAAILLLLLLVVSYKWKQKPRYEIRWKIIEQNDGNNYTFVDPTQLPYNQKWEFPRDKLRLGPVLGSGAFGKVVEATAYGLGTSTATRVAVKMLKPSAHSEEREALMSELKILSHLGYHDNIVNLLGACTQGGPMLMITEYCSHGDLLNFLRGRARDFVASFLSVDEGEEPTGYKNMAVQLIRLRSDSGISCCSEYQEMQPMMGPSLKQSCRRKDCLSVIDLMRFSLQVAQGLDFLSNQNCIHRDVAARNVLLTDRHVAKICDFGLARDIRDDDSYIVQGNSRLPVKWMAPESIFQCIYTVQSDVWSYGVLLWEIFSLGKSPYPNMAVDTNFYKMIKDGRHMAQPDFAPAEMYQLMTLCWNPEPTERPTFKRIGQLIDQLLPSNNDTSPSQRHQATYKNIDECREEEEQEEVEGQEPLKDCHDEDEPEEQERKERTTSRKNIYQLS